MQQCLLEYVARQAQSTAGPPSVDIHDILGDNDHVVVLGTASATARDGSSDEWRYTQIFHIRDGKATEVWGMAEDDAAVDPFLDIRPARLSTGEAQPANHRALLDGTCRVMEARVHQQALPDEAGLYLAPVA
jgi:hypothetical protein